MLFTDQNCTFLSLLYCAGESLLLPLLQYDTGPDVLKFEDLLWRPLLQGSSMDTHIQSFFLMNVLPSAGYDVCMCAYCNGHFFPTEKCTLIPIKLILLLDQRPARNKERQTGYLYLIPQIHYNKGCKCLTRALRIERLSLLQPFKVV